MTPRRPTLTIPAHQPIRFEADGTPTPTDLEGLNRDTIDIDGAPYLTRYYLLRTPLATIRLHHLHMDDPLERGFHTHPWDYVTHLLTGGYREHTDEHIADYEAPCILTRAATHAHRLELLAGPMWTMVTTGTIRQRWGFDQ